MNAPLTSHPVPPYRHTPLFPLGKDETPYRKIEVPGAANGGVRVEKIMGRDVLVVEREALRALTEAAFTDINHLLRPAHLAQAEEDRRRPGGLRQRQVRRLRSAQERQHRGRRRAADVPGHRHRHHHGQEGPARLHRRRGRGGARRGRARRLPEAQPALLAGRADLDVRGEEHPQQHAGADRHLRRGRGRLQAPVHRQGRRLGQQGVPVPGDAVDPHPRPHDRVPQGEDPHARHRRVPALSPGDRDRRHLGRTDDEDRQARLDQVSRQPADARAARTATPSAISRWSRRCSS